MKTVGLLFAFVAALLLSSGCSQDVGNSSEASIKLKLPDAFTSANGKVTAASSAACFAINLSGSGIKDTAAATSGDPAYGKFVGLAPAGGTLEIKGIPRKDDHNIQIFYVPSAEGCTPFEASSGLAATFGSNRVHVLADKPLGPLGVGDNFVQVSVELPSSQNTMSALNLASSASTCSQEGPTVSQFGVALGSGASARGTMANGDQLMFRIKDQTISTDQPLDFSGRLVPSRLQESPQ